LEYYISPTIQNMSNIRIDQCKERAIKLIEYVKYLLMAEEPKQIVINTLPLVRLYMKLCRRNWIQYKA
jgi:hypothetical protein